jgi:protein SCO1/2
MRLLALIGLAFSADVPEDSLYQLDLDLTAADGSDKELSHFQGQPVLISMFYGKCPSACPMLISELGQVLDEAKDEDLKVLLVSLAPDQDTPELLTELAERHGLDEDWLLVAPKPGQERTLAATLGIAYRVMPNGHINHSSILTLLDAQGRPIARVDGLGQSHAPILEALD